MKLSKRHKNFTVPILIALFIFIVSLFFKDKVKEGLSTYSECINKGYTKSYCVQTPTSTFGPGICKCKDGHLGRRIAGFMGECVCDYRYF